MRTTLVLTLLLPLLHQQELLHYPLHYFLYLLHELPLSQGFYFQKETTKEPEFWLLLLLLHDVFDFSEILRTHSQSDVPVILARPYFSLFNGCPHCFHNCNGLTVSEASVTNYKALTVFTLMIV
jgi:hypothetical protein